MSVNNKNVIDILNKIEETIGENKAFLTELDAAIGDGDHGLNMHRGFQAVKEKLKDHTDNSISDILKLTGMTLVSTVGGASGPLYGTAFMKASMVMKDKETLELQDFLNILKAALEGIIMRGKAATGEKTMLDALSPAITALEASIEAGLCATDCLYKAKEAAREGVEFTKTIPATKGRASYLGERSIGHQDAGATSSYLLLDTIYNEVKLLKEQA